MSTPDLEHQRAERFAHLVDRRDPPAPQPGEAIGDEARLVAIGQRLAAVDGPRIDPKARADLRAVLVAAAEREQAGRAALQPATRAASATPSTRLTAALGAARRLLGSSPQTQRARTRSLIIAGVAVGAITVSGISNASEDSVPGDALYAMKRSTERAQLALAGTDDSKAERLLDFARTRAEEAYAVRRDPTAVDRLLAESDRETAEAVALLTRAAVERRTEAPLNVVAAFVRRQRANLAGLPAGADPYVAQRAATSTALLEQVTTRIDAVRAALPCGADTGRTDALGPVPAGCTSGTGRPGQPR